MLSKPPATQTHRTALASTQRYSVLQSFEEGPRFNQSENIKSKGTAIYETTQTVTMNV